MRGVLYVVLMIGWLASRPSSPASAQTPTCEKLKGDQKAVAEKLLNSQYPYACCNETIATCIKKKPICSLAWRLSESICRKASRGQIYDRILHDLSNRARTMSVTKQSASIDLSGLPAAGDPEAPVELVEYACPRCPYCARSTPILYNAVVSGPLKGKVKLYFKTFPLRNHKYAKENGLAFAAAARLGRYWEYILYSYERFDQFWVAIQSDWARAVGMDREMFKNTMSDPKTRETLIASKKEGILNKVEGTPTYFINGRKYLGDLDKAELFDVLEEEYERLNKIKYR